MYTFNQMLDLCWKAALDNTALAKLYEATSEYGIDRVYTVFRGPNNTTIMVNCNANGEMEGPVTVDSPWMEDEVIHPPIHMEEEHANQLLLDAGWSDDWKQVTLRKPLGPNLGQEPLFIYQYTSGLNIGVGTWSGNVTRLS
jgi:hypothetical protein